MKNKYLTIIFVTFFVPAASAVVIDVPGDYATIQEGIDAAVNGDTVLVAPGEYWESPIIEDKNIFLTTAQGPQNTTIRGNVQILGESVDTTCILQGLTITKDSLGPIFARSLLRIRFASPLILGNIIRDNETWDAGAGISCFRAGANTIIRGNIVRSNLTRDQGGGIVGAPGITIEQNIISNNSAGFSPCERGNAGGILASSEIIRYNLIIDNETVKWGCDTDGGGILRTSYSNTLIYNNTIVGNSARRGSYDSNGGGIAFGINMGDSSLLRNNIIAFNPYGGGVSASIADSTWTGWDYNLVFGNDSANYIGMEPGPHDIQADPLFVDRFSGDYNLLPNSPCIDAGDPDFPLDPDGTRADIGAYYYDQQVGVDDPGEPSGPYRFQLHQNYPNPFNAQTIISYALSKNSVVSLMIFSIRGQLVESIANKEMQTAGEHQYAWDGTDKNGKEVSTGIYFYELYVDDYRESKAMIMIK